MRCDAIFYTGTSPSLDTALSQAHRAASYLFPTHLFRHLSERFCILLLLGLVEQALLIFICFCPCVFDIFPVAGQQCSLSFFFSCHECYANAGYDCMGKQRRKHHKPRGFKRAGLFGFLYTSQKTALDAFDLPASVSSAVL
jgi:hypothetical protein